MPRNPRKDTEEIPLVEEELTYRVRGCVFEVYRRPGSGFLESVYEKALLHELEMQGISAKGQVPFSVAYKDVHVGHFVADIVVEEKLILAHKAQANLNAQMCKAQLLNYIKASGVRLGLLINFTHPKATVERFVV